MDELKATAKKICSPGQVNVAADESNTKEHQGGKIVTEAGVAAAVGTFGLTPPSLVTLVTTGYAFSLVNAICIAVFFCQATEHWQFDFDGLDQNAAMNSAVGKAIFLVATLFTMQTLKCRLVGAAVNIIVYYQVSTSIYNQWFVRQSWRLVTFISDIFPAFTQFSLDGGW